MIHRRLLSLGFLFAGLAGCLSGDPRESDEHLTIEYDFVDGLGARVERVRIDPDGMVTWQLEDTSKPHNVLDPDDLAELHRKVEAAGFPRLDPVYGCGGCADDAVHTVTVNLDGTSFTVQAEHGEELPAPLRALIDDLYEIAQQPYTTD